MKANPPITIHAEWIPSGSFWIWAKQKGFPLKDVARLKGLLFAWHEPSFYGTFIEGLEMGDREGVLLPAAQALDYFAAPPWVQHANLCWDEETAPLAELSRAAAKALEEDRLVPDFEKWKAGGWGWKLIPGHASDSERLPAFAYPPYWDEWIQAVMLERYPDRPIVRSGEERMRRAAESAERGLEPRPAVFGGVPNLSPQQVLWGDSEDDWLMSIGWTADEMPFRVALRLSEPEAGDVWRLDPVLQDRSDPDRLIGCDSFGRPLAELPEEWQPYVPRIAQTVARWIAIVPSLSQGSGEGQPSGSDQAEAGLGLRTSLDYDEAFDFLTDKSLALAEYGQTVILPPWWEQLRKTKPRLKAKLRPGFGSNDESLFGLNRIVEFDWRMAVGEEELDEAEFRGIVDRNRQLVRIRGRWVLLDSAVLSQIRQLIRKARKRKGLTLRDVLEMHLLGPQQMPDEDGAADPRDALRVEVELNEHLRRFIDRLQQAQSMTELKVPASFRGTLRHYQALGASWLLFLRRFGFGGCLADDMGLGKTIQWITYLLYVKENEKPAAPSLLICPTSVLGNWQKELERFAPSLRVRLHYGPNRTKGESFAGSVKGYDLVLTSYTLAHLDETELMSVRWDSICLDEAQNIKNPYTKQSMSVRKLEAGHRIAMTGTPIENRLSELWSIFDFINPGYLGNLRSFTSRFAPGIEKSRDRQLIGQLQKLIRPFMLRRVKHDPAIRLDLPDKLESKTFVSLTAEQAGMYENIIQDLFDRLDRLPPMERRGLILAALTKLKQVCNHPALYTKEGTAASDRKQRSQKVDRLLAMVKELRQEGDRCLIFTQFVEMGQILQRVLAKETGETVLFMHGGTPKAQRDSMIARFQSPAEDFGIFLLSLKAGGIGLNLTAANHVFHFDRWWNPAVENQATDRAFRIGQTKDVHVHKFVTLGTLEERIDEMIERKLLLSSQIVGSGEQWITELSTDQLKELFALRKQWVEV